MNATESAISRLQDLIMEGRYRPGDRLPVEAELATMIGVSRNTLREAARALSFVGVLEVRQGDGTYIADMDPDRLFAGLRLYAKLADDERLGSVLEARRVLEPELTSLAATRRTDSEVEELAKVLDEMNAAPGIVAMVDADHEFHRLIARAARSPVLEHVLTNLSVTTLRLRVWHGQVTNIHRADTLTDHQSIFEAIRDQRPQLARAAALIHVSKVEQWLLRPGATDGFDETNLLHDDMVADEALITAPDTMTDTKSDDDPTHTLNDTAVGTVTAAAADASIVDIAPS